MSFVEENEISSRSNGGTEITKRSIGKRIPDALASEFQIVPSRVRDIEEDKIRVYWAHDTALDPECAWIKDEKKRNAFHKYVFVSHWQMNEFHQKLGLPLNEKVVVIENPIEPFESHEKPKDVVNLVYFSTPQRGLELLVPVFQALAEKHENVHLHVFSSFKIYGWEDADKNFEPLYERIRQHPKMTYHGYADQETLREKLKECHILAYPSIWQETSCRVLMESMSAGLLCVHPNYAALSETSGGITLMYQYSQDMNEHAQMLYRYLDRAIEDVNKEEVQSYLKFVKAYADVRYNLDKISTQWESLLVDLKEQYPTLDSRKTPQDLFVYKV